MGYSGYPKFGSPDSLAINLKQIGFDILTLANNHSMDKGTEGLVRTIEVLDSLGIKHVGTYTNYFDWEEERVLFIKKKGFKFAILNYTYGTNGIPVPEEHMVNLIEKKRIESDLELAHKFSPDAIIVLLHFGKEYKRTPDSYQKEFVKFVFEQGADIILGGHPHVVQPYEILEKADIYGHKKERLVIYSLGNFVSGQQRRYVDGGIIFNIVLEKNPDINSDQKILFKEVYHEPVWVYVKKSSRQQKNTFHVLPVKNYIENSNLKLNLSLSALTRMSEFYDDTQSHLQESFDKIKFQEKPLLQKKGKRKRKN